MGVVVVAEEILIRNRVNAINMSSIRKLERVAEYSFFQNYQHKNQQYPG